MLQIEYRAGDATKPQGAGTKIIIHCVNDVGAWGAGFVLALSRKWREPERQNRLWHQAGELDGVPFQLGQVQMVKVTSDIFVANLIGQRGIRRRQNDGVLPPVRYEAIRQGLACIRSHAIALNASAHNVAFSERRSTSPSKSKVRASAHTSKKSFIRVLTSPSSTMA